MTSFSLSSVKGSSSYACSYVLMRLAFVLSIALLAGCSQEGSGSNQITTNDGKTEFSFGVPDSVYSPRVLAEDYELILLVNGNPVPVTRDAGNWTASITLPRGTEFNAEFRWLVDDLVVAELSGDYGPVEPSLVINVNSSEYKLMDTDNDGISDIAELDRETDPLDDDSPGPSLPDPSTDVPTSPVVDTPPVVDTSPVVGTSPVVDTPPAIVLPTVSTTFPAVDARKVEVNANLYATFNKAILASSVDSTQFTLELEGEVVDATVTFDGTTATLDPFENLLASSYYKATLKSGIVDIDGNALGQYQWDFYTDGNGWTPARLFSGTGRDPVISVSANGDAVAVVSECEEMCSTYTRRYNHSQQSWSKREKLENQGIEGARGEKVKLHSNGDVVLVWGRNGNDFVGSERYDDLMASRFDASAGTWHESKLSLTNPDTREKPQVDIDSDGNAIAVWRQNEGSSIRVATKRYFASTKRWGSTEYVDTQGGAVDSPQIAIDSNGNAFVVWSQLIGARSEIFASRYDMESRAWGIPRLLESDNAGSDAELPQVGVDANGNAIVVWQQPNESGSGIYVNQYSDNTDQWGVTERLDTDNALSVKPKIGIDSDGYSIVVWLQIDAISSANKIVSRRCSASFCSWSKAITLVEAKDDSRDFKYNLNMNANGDAFLVWSRQVGSRSSVFAKRYSKRFGIWGADALVKTLDEGYAYDVEVGVDGNGNAILLWEQLNSPRRPDFTVPVDIDISRFNLEAIPPE